MPSLSALCKPKPVGEAAGHAQEEPANGFSTGASVEPSAPPVSLSPAPEVPPPAYDTVVHPSQPDAGQDDSQGANGNTQI